MPSASGATFFQPQRQPPPPPAARGSSHPPARVRAGRPAPPPSALLRGVFTTFPPGQRRTLGDEPEGAGRGGVHAPPAFFLQRTLYMVVRGRAKVAPALRLLPRRLRLPARSSPPAQSSHPPAWRRPPRWDAAAAVPAPSPLQPPPPPPPRSPLSVCAAPASSRRCRRFGCVQGVFCIFVSYPFPRRSPRSIVVIRNSRSPTSFGWSGAGGTGTVLVLRLWRVPAARRLESNSEKVASSLPGTEEVAAR